ncbi:chromatin assembly factor 1 subunit B-like [Dendronephthya gigantea]|uniref:chromatin assembly factor 1 subunit B-like n=1 Tax=Dendronephthya gigantea TaxID=151771 RepID=UPI00106B7342|nr:chromatin assembly factor 1 subunit B-like [Dendronephthya gigantea]
MILDVYPIGMKRLILVQCQGHIEDVYDLAWSPNRTQLISGSVDNSVIIWDTNKGDKLRILKDHRQYVQGVSWDPCGTYVTSYSCDRTCRIYNTSNYRCCFNINKVTVPSCAKSETGTQSSKQIKIFHDETMPSFFRRLTFSPDGLLLFVPGGKFEIQEKMVNTTFVFTKASMNKPVMYFPAKKKPTIAKYYTNLIDECSNDSKKLFKVVTSLCKTPRDDPQLPPHDDLCQLVNTFGEYFYRKIEIIRKDIDDITIDPQPVEYRRPDVKLESFTPLSNQEVYDIIMQSSNASCELDPIPSWLALNGDAPSYISALLTFKPASKLPYRTVIAVASLDSVVLYDTQRTLPFGFLSNMHYASLTDIAWSGDGRILAISSRDGYCSLVTFDDNELGVPYSQTAREIIENSTVPAKESSPNRRIITTPRCKTPDSGKDERTPPKIEKLSIKNFVTVNAPKANSSQSASVQSSVKTANAQNDGGETTEPAPRRVGFVTVKPPMPVPSSTAGNNSDAAMTTVSMATQPRTVNVTTLQAKGTASLENDCKHLNTNSSACEEVKTVSSANQPRRVGFVTIKSPQDSRVPHRSPTNPSSQNTSDSLPGGEPVKSAHEPRRVNFVTLKSPQNSTRPPREILAISTSTNHSGSDTPTEREGCASMTQPPPPRVNFATTEVPSPPTEKATQATQQTVSEMSNQSSTIHSTSMASTSVKAAQDNITRQDRPPVPLEPEVTIINH